MKNEEYNTPIFVAHPGLPYLYQEFQRCAADRGFQSVKEGDVVILRAVFLPFSIYAPWDRVEGKVLAVSKGNIKVDIKSYMYTDKIWIPNWVIEDVISSNKTKRPVKHKTSTATKPKNDSPED